MPVLQIILQNMYEYMVHGKIVGLMDNKVKTKNTSSNFFPLSFTRKFDEIFRAAV